MSEEIILKIRSEKLVISTGRMNLENKWDRLGAKQVLCSANLSLKLQLKPKQAAFEMETLLLDAP